MSIFALHQALFILCLAGQVPNPLISTPPTLGPGLPSVPALTVELPRAQPGHTLKLSSELGQFQALCLVSGAGL